MSLGLIWAQDEAGVIGRDGAMPWRLSEDLVRFKSLTMGSVVIMGRRTWDSLPVASRPLEGRTNIVVTRSPEWSANGATRASSVAEALGEAGDAVAWVIGGAQIYAATIDHAQFLEVTVIRGRFDGDAYAPVIGDRWLLQKTDPAEGWLESKTGIQYRFARYSAVVPLNA